MELDLSPETIRAWAVDPDAYLLDQDEDLLLADDAHIDLVLDLVLSPATVKGAVLASAIREWGRGTLLKGESSLPFDDGHPVPEVLRSAAERLFTGTGRVTGVARYLQRLVDWSSCGCWCAEDAWILAADLDGGEPLDQRKAQYRAGALLWVFSTVGGTHRRTVVQLDTGRVWTRLGSVSSSPLDNAPAWLVSAAYSG